MKNLAKLVKYVNKHLEAGHDLKNPKLVTDLDTLLTDLHKVLDSLGPPATLDQRVAFLVRQSVEQSRSDKEIMGKLDTISAALDAAGSAAAEEAAQVKDHLARLGTQISDLQTELDSITADTVTDDEIAALQDKAAALAEAIDAIDSDGETPVEEPPVEEPPVEEPTP